MSSVGLFAFRGLVVDPYVGCFAWTSAEIEVISCPSFDSSACLDAASAGWDSFDSFVVGFHSVGTAELVVDAEGDNFDLKGNSKSKSCAT